MRNVIFDLGGVRLEWNPAKILARCYPDRASQELIRDAMFKHNDWLAFDLGDLSEADLITRVQDRTGLPAPEVTRVLDVIRDSLVEVPEIVAILHDLKTRGARLYCLSNMPVSIFSHVRQRYTFWSAFEGIVVSGEVRMKKPDRTIFEYILARHGLNATETVFVDDHAPNIEGARAVGI